MSRATEQNTSPQALPAAAEPEKKIYNRADIENFMQHGELAFFEDKTLDDCPFPEGSIPARAWKAGFEDIRDAEQLRTSDPYYGLPDTY